jgi:hypothetical protein
MRTEEIFDDLRSCNGGLLFADKRKTAELLNCSVSLINKNMAKGRNIPAYLKVGGKVLFNLRDIAQFIEDHKIHVSISFNNKDNL